MVQRVAFKMKLKPGCLDEYQRRHNQLWPEMAVALKQAGISDYSIYFDPETLVLFAVQKLSNINSASELPQKAIVQKWWAYMADIMQTNPDNSPTSTDLSEVFHLD